jgi:short-subunit dehydrogenase
MIDTSRYGPAALVTGASSGIGEAMARDLAAAGLDLILMARGADRLEALAAELREAHGITARAAPVDVGQFAALTRPLDGVTQDVGLVVAAAGYGTTGPLAAADLATEADMVAVNCTGTLTLARWAAARMRERGVGASCSSPPSSASRASAAARTTPRPRPTCRR